MMCATCGCSSEMHDHDRDHAHGHDHDHHDHHGHHLDHGHDHGHHHDHDHGQRHGRIVSLEVELLEKNRRVAERNRAFLASRRLLCLNLVSSPGSGKTTLLERTITDHRAGGDHGAPLLIIEGDQATDHDARRIREAGARAVQINTGTGCHLDAAMVAGALERLAPPAGAMVVIENVGNLVCPALFDLGEAAKVVVASVTEGEDKPLKYPHMFQASRLVLLNKIDLLPHLRFDVDRFETALRRVNPRAELLRISAQSGEGMAGWYGWLEQRRRAVDA
jgi:hydrogenase nickel incorporation protein HypB